MDTLWSHLPNARHIDWVLKSLGTDLKKWDAAWNASRNAAWNAAWNAARDAAENAAWDVARDADWVSAYNATRGAALGAASDATRTEAWFAARVSALNAARGVILALISYDDCDQYLDMTYDQLLIYAMLSERPQAVLLLPLKWIQEHEHALVTPT